MMRKQMKTNNKNSTRYYSSLQESKVAKLLNGNTVSNSGAGHFAKGDVVVNNADLLVECKTVTKEKTSFSIKKEWLDKNVEESFATRKSNSCVAFSFDPDAKKVYFVIDEKLMCFLTEKLAELYE